MHEQAGRQVSQHSDQLIAVYLQTLYCLYTQCIASSLSVMSKSEKEDFTPSCLSIILLPDSPGNDLNLPCMQSQLALYAKSATACVTVVSQETSQKRGREACGTEAHTCCKDDAANLR